MAPPCGEPFAHDDVSWLIAACGSSSSCCCSAPPQSPLLAWMWVLRRVRWRMQCLPLPPAWNTTRDARNTRNTRDKRGTRNTPACCIIHNATITKSTPQRHNPKVKHKHNTQYNAHRGTTHQSQRYHHCTRTHTHCVNSSRRNETSNAAAEAATLFAEATAVMSDTTTVGCARRMDAAPRRGNSSPMAGYLFTPTTL